MDYVKSLADAINHFNPEDYESCERLKKLICVISTMDYLKEDSLVRELLYIGSIKMRTFGYNRLNKLERGPISAENVYADVASEAVLSLYKSTAHLNNTLDKNQKNVLQTYAELRKKRILISAPTSFGKTYMMKEILYQNRDKYNNIILVFPTVALINENIAELKKFLKNRLNYKIHDSADKNINQNEKNIFVFTPERVLQLLSSYPELKIDFFFFDEMYKIDEGFGYEETNEIKDIFRPPRARTFRIALYLLSKQTPEFYIAGPYLNVNNFSIGMKRYIEKNEIHIEEISFEPTVKVKVEAWKKNLVEYFPFVENIKTKIDFDSKKEQVAEVIKHIINKDYGKTLLYCAYPGKILEYSKAISESVSMEDSELGEIIQHLERRYDYEGSCKRWSLIHILKNGYGVHHGKLPRYVQNEILRLFNNNCFKFMFCTSTITEGVNTDARNIVLVNNSKGMKPLTTFDIKNINGRAGRYHHNFIGRVFYMDKDQVTLAENSETSLDFITYSSNESPIDIDNTDVDDLDDANKERKLSRDVYFSSIPYTVFVKNRTIPREIQKGMIDKLRDDEYFNKFRPYVYGGECSVETFIFKIFDELINILGELGAVNEHELKSLPAIAKRYYYDGFEAFLKYELSQNKGYDRSYNDAFTTQRDIIEFKIPMMTQFFESIFNHVLSLREMKWNISLSQVTNFFEKGVCSEVGNSLTSFGFPPNTMRKIEKKYTWVERLTLEKIDDSVKEHFEAEMDEFEKRIFNEFISNL